jgi:hypothetical protein
LLWLSRCKNLLLIDFGVSATAAVDSSSSLDCWQQIGIPRSGQQTFFKKGPERNPGGKSFSIEKIGNIAPSRRHGKARGRSAANEALFLQGAEMGASGVVPCKVPLGAHRDFAFPARVEVGLEGKGARAWQRHLALRTGVETGELLKTWMHSLAPSVSSAALSLASLRRLLHTERSVFDLASAARRMLHVSTIHDS